MVDSWSTTRNEESNNDPNDDDALDDDDAVDEENARAEDAAIAFAVRDANRRESVIEFATFNEVATSDLEFRPGVDDPPGRATGDPT